MANQELGSTRRRTRVRGNAPTPGVDITSTAGLPRRNEIVMLTTSILPRRQCIGACTDPARMRASAKAIASSIWRKLMVGSIPELRVMAKGRSDPVSLAPP